MYFQLQKSTRHTASQSPLSKPYDINMRPATEEEHNMSQQIKQNAKSLQSTPSTIEELKKVFPVIVSATLSPDLQIRAYISGIYEDGGTCTFTAKNGNNKITKQSLAFKDATTTTCEPLKILRSEFSSTGMWDLSVGYLSSTSRGASQPTIIEVK